LFCRRIIIASITNLRHRCEVCPNSWKRFFVSDLEVDVNQFVWEGRELVGETGAILTGDVCSPSVRVVLKSDSSESWKKIVTWKQIRKFKMNRNIFEKSNTENEILMNSKSFDCELKAFRWFQLKVRLF